MSYLFFFYFIHFFFFFGKMKLKWGRYGGEPGSINGRKSLAPGHLGSPAKVGTHVRERNIFFFFEKKNIFLLRILSDTSVGFLLEMNVKVQRFLFNGFNDFI